MHLLSLVLVQIWQGKFQDNSNIIPPRQYLHLDHDLSLLITLTLLSKLPDGKEETVRLAVAFETCEVLTYSAEPGDVQPPTQKKMNRHSDVFLFLFPITAMTHLEKKGRPAGECSQ